MQKLLRGILMQVVNTAIRQKSLEHGLTFVDLSNSAGRPINSMTTCTANVVIHQLEMKPQPPLEN
jgi:hypothetical protein